MDNSSLELNCVFVETNFQTRFVVLLNKENVSLFKEKLCKEHSECFPEIGDITISAMKVELNGHFYNLPDSMNVRKAFDNNINEGWFLYVDAAVRDVDKSQLLTAAGSNLNPDELFEREKKFTNDLTLEEDAMKAEGKVEKKSRKRTIKSSDAKRSNRKKLSENLKLCVKVEVKVGSESCETRKDIGSSEKDIINIGEYQHICSNPDELLEKKTEIANDLNREEILKTNGAEETTNKRRMKMDAKKRNKKKSHESSKLCENVKVEVATKSCPIEKDIENIEKDGICIGQAQKTSDVEMHGNEEFVE